MVRSGSTQHTQHGVLTERLRTSYHGVAVAAAPSLALRPRHRLDEEVSARQTAALGMRAVGGAGGLAVGLLSAVMRLAPGNSPLVRRPPRRLKRS